MRELKEGMVFTDGYQTLTIELLGLKTAQYTIIPNDGKTSMSWNSRSTAELKTILFDMGIWQLKQPEVSKDCQHTDVLVEYWFSAKAIKTCRQCGKHLEKQH